MNYTLPEHLLSVIKSLPSNVTAALLLRHAERLKIIDGDDGTEVDLTPLGYAQSLAFGKRLKQRLEWAHYSPLLRAKRTVEQFIAGAEVTDLIPNADNLLGCPGPFVVDCNAGQHLFATLGTECLVKKLASGEYFNGIRTAKEGAQIFLDHLKNLLKSQKGLGIMISHDAILIPLLAAWSGECFKDKWLDSLDGALIVANHQGQLLIYRNNKVMEL
jgi:hypothetical protein